MTLETWLLFSGAALVVILIPGPLSLLMISNSLNYGLRRSYPAFLGGVFASICLLSASALGLGALLLASEQLFSALKIVGALYLFYLAWQSWQQSRQPSQGRKYRRRQPCRAFAPCLAVPLSWAPATPKTFCFSPPSCRNFSVPSRPFTATADHDRHLDGTRPAVQAGLWPRRPWCSALFAQRRRPELVQPRQCGPVRLRRPGLADEGQGSV